MLSSPVPFFGGLPSMMLALGRMIRSLRAIDGARAVILRGTASLTLAVLAACGGDSSGPPKVVSVSISPSPADVVQGATRQLLATPKDGKGATISGLTASWQSSNNAIVTVNSATGVVTGVAPGS